MIEKKINPPFLPLFCPDPLHPLATRLGGTPVGTKTRTAVQNDALLRAEQAVCSELGWARQKPSSVLLCLRRRCQIPQGTKKSFFPHVHGILLWLELSSLKRIPVCTLKGKGKEKKKPHAKYPPAHTVLPRRADERKSKPDVTDVSHVAACTAGRLAGAVPKWQPGSPPHITALIGSDSMQRCKCKLLVYMQVVIVFFLFAASVKGN